VAAAGTALALAAFGCATTDDRDMFVASGHPIAPYESHEVCVQLAAGERLDWSYGADAAVAFDIRYQDGNATVIPVARGAASDAGLFRAVLEREYCTHWEAGPRGVRLDYRVRRLPEAK
jgi:hypothetical protein